MIGAKVKIEDATRTVSRRMKDANIRTLQAAGAYVCGIARKSIKIAPDAAPIGHQPHSRSGRLKNAIVFSVQRDLSDVVIGPSANAMGKLGATHEWGGTEPPKKPPVARKHNWRLKLGGHGPIRLKGETVFFTKIKTVEQLQRAITLAPEVLAAPGDLVIGRNTLYDDPWGATFTNQMLVVPNYRVSISTPTTYRVKVYHASTSGTPQYYGRLSARRMR